MTPPGRGVLVVAKPAGPTSFDVVARVRRALHVRRVGHAGTLDPGAAGVLPILIGEATKLMPYLADQAKEYRATVRFGLTTDTLDIGGRVLSTTPVPPLARADVEQACRRFVGRVAQVPPMYSALRHEGRRLYELARRGVEVEREPREVVIHSITVEDIGPAATATLRVACGKGTYVRVLAADLGAALGVGACIERLVRTRVGPFRLEDAVPWEEVERGDPSGLWSRVLPPESALAPWPEIRLGPEDERTFVCGQSVVVSGRSGGSGFVRVHGADGALIGVGELAGGGSRVRPVRVLHVDRPRARVLPA